MSNQFWSTVRKVSGKREGEQSITLTFENNNKNRNMDIYFLHYSRTVNCFQLLLAINHFYSHLFRFYWLSAVLQSIRDIR